MQQFTFPHFSDEIDLTQRCEILSSSLQSFICSTKDLDTNKQIANVILFEAWQQNWTEFDYEYSFPAPHLTTGLYLQLIRILDLEKEFVKTLYMVPRQVVSTIICEIIGCDPLFCLRVVYDPALFVAISLDVSQRKDLITQLRRLVIENASSITDIRSRNTINDANVDYMYSSPLYLERSPRRKVMISKLSNNANFTNLIEDLQISSNHLKMEDKEYFMDLLIIFDHLSFVAWSEHEHKNNFKISKELIIRKTVLKLKDSGKYEYIVINIFCMHNISKIEDNDTMSNLLRFANDIILKLQQLSNLTSRSERISKRLQEDKIGYLKAINRIKARETLNSMELSNADDNQLLNKHEESFVMICRTVRQNLNYDASFALRSFNSDITFRVDSSSSHPSKKDLEEYCQWINESISKELIGYVSLLKLMIQYFDLFVGTSYNLEKLSTLILENGLHVELYQSVKRIIKIVLQQNRLQVAKVIIELFIETFSKTPLHTRLIFRDYILSDRPSNMSITSPTFDSWDIWPFDLKQRVTAMCNQLVSSEFMKDKSVDHNDDIKPEIMDSLILSSLVSPYYLLHRLIWEVIQHKGQGLMIHKILNKIKSICWIRATSKSPALFIMVLEEILTKYDEGSVALTLQENKNLIYFISLSMTGNTIKQPTKLTSSEIGEWGNSNILLDIREYITHCIVPYLQNSSNSNRESTLKLSLSTLSALFLPGESALVLTDQHWFLKSKPFSLLHNIALLYDQRKNGYISITSFCLVYTLLKEFIRLLTEYIESFHENLERDGKHLNFALLRWIPKITTEIRKSIAGKIFDFYKKSLEYKWTTQLFLRPFIQIYANIFGFNVGRPFIPASLCSFCGISEQEFSKIEDVKVLVSGKSTLTIMNQINLFLEACKLSIDWCHKFSMMLNDAESVSKPDLRSIFRSFAPCSFCTALSDSVKEESEILLNVLIRNLVSHGILSGAELLTIDEEHKDIDSLIVSELDIDASEKKGVHEVPEFMIEEEDDVNYISNQSINDLNIVQNIIHVIKNCFITKTVTLNYLVLLFYTITQTLEILSEYQKLEENVYIFLLTIVEMIDKKFTGDISKDEKSFSLTDTNKLSTSKSTNKKKRKKKKGNQQAKTSEILENKPREFSEWQQKLIFNGINKIKKQNGWQDTVKRGLKF
ncbi:6425_t:CDS:10 [Diversispora eburnea]|uniref:6425_t:CDS:1 n=2 Tax=Diversisporales TaxID=214509 RepID=A0A9N8YZN8_9GLOM|nr:6425_t:CDS:10 [Diversispora eburnea]